MPDTRTNMSAYTSDGTVRMAMMHIRPTKAMGLGIRLEAEISEKGIDRIAPTTVPRKAMHTVSSIR